MQTAQTQIRHHREEGNETNLGEQGPLGFSRSSSKYISFLIKASIGVFTGIPVFFMGIPVFR